MHVNWRDLRDRRIAEPGAGEIYAAAQRAYDDEPHVPAEPDPNVAAILERVSRAITGDGRRDGREVTSGDEPCL